MWDFFSEAVFCHTSDCNQTKPCTFTQVHTGILQLLQHLELWQESFKEMTSRGVSLPCWVGRKLGEMGGNGQQTAVLSSAAAQCQAADCQQHSGVCDVFESWGKGQTWSLLSSTLHTVLTCFFWYLHICMQTKVHKGKFDDLKSYLCLH